MKKVFAIGMFLAATVSLIASALITWVVWQSCIPDKAFHCNDEVASGWLTSIETHRDAGDVLLRGWTWDELVRIRTGFEIAFFTIWVSLSTVFYLLGSIGSPGLSPTPTAGTEGKHAGSTSYYRPPPG
jgi:hypothetical protein